MAERSMQGRLHEGRAEVSADRPRVRPRRFRRDAQARLDLNILHDDRQAMRWFDLARRAPDPQLSAEGKKAWRNLHESNQLFRTTVWFYPIYSTRWKDIFAYGQVKTELRKNRWVQPYLSSASSATRA
jgi:hypothetical protein